MATIPYKRVLLKLSGESLLGNKTYGLSADILAYYANEIKVVAALGIEIAVVIGGGNIYRGMNESETGIERQQGDYMGMLATIINGMALQAALEKAGMKTRLMSNIKVEQVAETYIRRRALRHLEKMRIVIFGGGTGNPNFTTDSAGVLKAIEINADIIIKGTRVDGVFDKDPEKFPDAVIFKQLKFQEALNKNFKIMDKTAFAMCQERDLKLVVFNFNKPNNLYRLLTGEAIGTIVTN